jgi:hypothetical protein
MLDGRYTFGFSTAIGLLEEPASCKYIGNSIPCRNHLEGILDSSLLSLQSWQSVRILIISVNAQSLSAN